MMDVAVNPRQRRLAAHRELTRMKQARTRKVELFDTSLRDGLQQPNLDISVPNAVSLLQRMAAFGVHYAEIGFAGANQFVSDLAARSTPSIPAR